MRCSCKECGIYMVQADAPHLGCQPENLAANFVRKDEDDDAY